MLPGPTMAAVTGPMSRRVPPGIPSALDRRSTERNAHVPPKSVLGRALTLLTAFRPGDAELTLAELTRRTGLPKPTAHRMLAELAEWNVVERTPHGIRLGMRLFELGQLAPLQRGLREAAAPFLSDLFEATHETVHLAVPDGLDVVYVQKLPGRHGPRISSRIGGRMPADCTGVGQAMLAFATGSTPGASRPPSAPQRWGCRASCAQAPDPAQAPDRDATSLTRGRRGGCGRRLDRLGEPQVVARRVAERAVAHPVRLVDRLLQHLGAGRPEPLERRGQVVGGEDRAAQHTLGQQRAQRLGVLRRVPHRGRDQHDLDVG